MIATSMKTNIYEWIDPNFRKLMTLGLGHSLVLSNFFNLM